MGTRTSSTSKKNTSYVVRRKSSCDWRVVLRKLQFLIILYSTTDTHVIIDGKSILDFTRANFLGMLANQKVKVVWKEWIFLLTKKIKDTAVAAVQRYGTGTCGPRGFSGTIDAHLKLEERVKKFMDAEDAVMYSYGFVTVSSIINAFSGRGDILVVYVALNT